MVFSTLMHDLASGLSWAWMDIKCKYRRSVIGPFWETINIFVMVMGMTYVSSAIFNGDALSSMPYVGLGIIAWSAMTALVSEGTGIFVQHKDYIRNSSLHINIYISRTIFRTFIIFSHHLILYFIGVLLLPIPFGWMSLLSLVGILLLLVNAFWVVPLLGYICARYRDLEMIVRNLLQLTFFVTPIFWNYATISPARADILRYNPFFYFLEAIRAPLLGHELPFKHYVVIGGITVGGFILLGIVRRLLRRNLAFYV